LWVQEDPSPPVVLSPFIFSGVICTLIEDVDLAATTPNGTRNRWS
jgi:hypothetical protein